jgi:hypothetical protein
LVTFRVCTLGLTFKALIHALNCETSRMTRELLDVTTQYATGDEAV